MRFDILTIFPELFNIVHTGVTKRAFRHLKHQLYTIDYRRFTKNKHGNIDDTPFGGGSGMVLRPDVLRDTLASIPKYNKKSIIHFSPSAKQISHDKIIELSTKEQIILVCTRYKGLDQRAIDLYIDEEISISNIVLSGGELPALFLIDAICRWLPGVLHNKHSANEDSFATGLLDHPHYTKPSNFEGINIPQVLLSGNHANIHLWRLKKSMQKTKLIQPNLWQHFISKQVPNLSKEEQWQAWQVEHPECNDLPKPKNWKYTY